MTVKEIPETMLACQIVEFNQPYQTRRVSTPTNLHENDMLVRIGAASFCHTDMLALAGDFSTDLPCTASHEGAGTVVALGSAVEDFKIGDRVLCGILYHRCGVCPICAGPETETRYCGAAAFQGLQRGGFFCEYQAVDSREAVVLPDSLDFASAAPFACAGVTVWGGIVNANLKPGQTIALVGSGGGLGHLAIQVCGQREYRANVQFAKARGLIVIGIEARDAGLQISKEYGADFVVDAREGHDVATKSVQALTDGYGAHATVNISDAPKTAALAVAITRCAGAVVQIGLADPELPYQDFIFRGIRLIASMLCSREQTQEMLQVVAQRGIKVQKNVFRGFDEIPQLVQLAYSGEMLGKAVLVIDGEGREVK